jgi:hypothetical protein
LYIKAIGILEKAVGSKHPNVITSYENLELLYKAKGLTPEAITQKITALHSQASR